MKLEHAMMIWIEQKQWLNMQPELLQRTPLTYWHRKPYTQAPAQTPESDIGSDCGFNLHIKQQASGLLLARACRYCFDIPAALQPQHQQGSMAKHFSLPPI
jgi:hypothetical protein